MAADRDVEMELDIWGENTFIALNYLITQHDLIINKFIQKVIGQVY